MKTKFILLLVIIPVLLFSQSTGTYWKVPNPTTQMGKSFTDANNRPLVYIKSTWSYWQLTANVSSTETMASIIAGGKAVGLTPWQVINGVITPTDTTNRVITINGTFIWPGDGDVNASGTIFATDALYIKMYLAGMMKFTNLQKSRADVNGDGKITMGDALIVQLRAGISAYPPWSGSIVSPDTLRYFNAYTLYQHYPGKVKLAAKYPLDYTATTAYDVETGGDVHLPFASKLVLGGLTNDASPDTSTTIFKVADRGLGITGSWIHIPGVRYNITASGTLTVAQILSGVITVTNGGSPILTPPTATAMASAIPGCGRGTYFDLIVDIGTSVGASFNGSTGCTWYAGGNTFGGNSMITNAEKVGCVRFYFTSSTTCIMTRIY